MDLFSKWAWLVVSWMTPGQRVSPDTGTDFGDMGTAFGMDAYLSRPGGDDSAASRFSAQPERRPAKN